MPTQDMAHSGTMYVLQNGAPEHQVELYNPSTGQWTLGPAQQTEVAARMAEWEAAHPSPPRDRFQG